MLSVVPPSRIMYVNVELLYIFKMICIIMVLQFRCYMIEMIVFELYELNLNYLSHDWMRDLTIK